MKTVLLVLFTSFLASSLAQGPHEYDNMRDGVVLLFPGFDLIIPSFIPAEMERIEQEGYYDYLFWGDSAYANIELSKDEEYIEGLRVKRDTITISEDLDNSIGDKHFVIRPHDTLSRFKLFVASEERTYEVIDHRTQDEPLNRELDVWSDLSPYVELQDSALCFSVVKSEQVNMEFDVRKIHDLQDTSVLIPREYAIHAESTRNGRLYAHWTDNVILKIEHTNADGIVQIRYVVIWINDSC